MLKNQFPSNNQKPKRKYHPTLQICLNQEQREKLEKWADGRPIAAYIKDVLFVEERKPERSHGIILEDKKLFAKALGVLGQSRLASNLNQLAHAVNRGCLPVNQETQQAIFKACTSVIYMRDSFMKAMGLKTGSKAKPTQGDADDA